MVNFPRRCSSTAGGGTSFGGFRSGIAEKRFQSTMDRGAMTSQVKHPNRARILTVAKPELGTKRLCASCSAKFYDLNKDPIHCPKCGAVYEIAPVVTRARPDAGAAPATAAAPARPAAVAEEVAVPEPQDAEFVSLEEADAEASGAKKPAE